MSDPTQMTGPVWEEVRGHLFDREGVAISLRDWVLHFEDTPYRIVGRENPREDLWVSTIWEGISVNPNPDLPLVFETGVFRGKPGAGGTLVYSYRCATEARALAMHAYVAMYVARHATFPDSLPDDLDLETLR
jgi:hypothetical protein